MRIIFTGQPTKAEVKAHCHPRAISVLSVSIFQRLPFLSFVRSPFSWFGWWNAFFRCLLFRCYNTSRQRYTTPSDFKATAWPVLLSPRNIGSSFFFVDHFYFKYYFSINFSWKTINKLHVCHRIQLLVRVLFFVSKKCIESRSSFFDMFFMHKCRYQRHNIPMNDVSSGYYRQGLADILPYNTIESDEWDEERTSGEADMSETDKKSKTNTANEHWTW